ncbi:copper resistance protein CopC [Streptomyces sp. NPDC060194]|uniref:copper resistance protein CopC n=1 Tax=Streptomyces sp. NPDC060194 TaxID=3347069 RepID=UPI00365F0436
MQTHRQTQGQARGQAHGQGRTRGRSGARVRIPGAGGARGGRARGLLLVLAALFTVLGTAAPASAHAALIRSDPQQGSVVAKAPERVTLDFSEGIGVTEDAVRVLDPQGKRVDTGGLKDLSSGNRIAYAVDLRPGLPDGTFTVAWKAVSADSHPVGGAFTFSVGAPSETTVTTAGVTEDAGGGLVGLAYGVARYAAYAGYVLLVGGAAFVLACWPRGASVRPLQRLVVNGWVVLTTATIALLMLRTPYTGAAGIGEVLQTKTGTALVSRLLLLGAAALFVAVLFGAYAKREDPVEKRDLTYGLAIGGGVLSAGIGATWALSEHASTGIQSRLAMPLDVVHLLAVACWLGGLAALLVALFRGPAVDRAAVHRFSRLAFGSVVALAATGLYASWRQVGSWSALTGTTYGQLLLAKVALVAVLLGLARYSRRWTARLAEVDVAEAADGGRTEEAESVEPAEAVEREKVAVAAGAGGVEEEDPERAAQLARQRAAEESARERKERDADPERSGLRRSVLAEAAVAVVLLAVTTALTGTEPGRTEEQAAAAAAVQQTGPVSLTVPFDTGGANGKGKAVVDVDPGRSGGNEMHVLVQTPDGKPLDVPEVKVAFTLKSKGIGPLPVTPDRIAEGHWTAAGVQIPMPGDWEIAVTVRTSDVDQVTESKNAKIG